MVASEKSMYRYRGLTPTEVETSRQMHGDNIISPPPRDPIWKVYLSKYDDPVIRILLIAAFLAIAVGAVEGNYTEGIGIVIAVLLATTLAFVNEYRANREFEILNKVNEDQQIQVYRDGILVTVPRKDLVVGDIVEVSLGQEIPADGTIQEAVGLMVSQATLTGESEARRKVALGDPRIQEIQQTEESTIPATELFRGTMVEDGRGVFVIKAVGDKTELADLLHSATTQDTETDIQSPLNNQLERLSNLIGIVGLGVAALTYVALVIRGVIIGDLVISGGQWYFVILLTIGILFALAKVWLPIVYSGIEAMGREVNTPDFLEDDSFKSWLVTVGLGAGIILIGGFGGSVTGILQGGIGDWLPAEVGENLLRYFMVAVTIIVVAVPEGLAMSVTLSLAYAMRKMLQSNSLIRKMDATETAGAATVICSDKTGTLTMGNMSVHDLDFPSLGASKLPTPMIAEAFAANSTAHLSFENGTVGLLDGSNRTEGALLTWLHGHEFNYVPYRVQFELLDQSSFNSEKKFMATLGNSKVTEKKLAYFKGAPNILLQHASQQLTTDGVKNISASDRKAIEDSLLSFNKRAMRTLAFAYVDEIEEKAWASVIGPAELPKNLVWLGFVAISDPVRETVPQALAACKLAGIEVKIITGDQAETAQEIAAQIGLIQRDKPVHGEHISGEDFEKMNDNEAANALQDLKIMSRARPRHKLRMVRLLQGKSGGSNVVAVTGDGANDAPALNQADVGFSMGSGHNIAKEASDIVIINDAFDSVVSAVMWGRSLYENIQRFILFQLTVNVAALGVALLGPFINVEFPLTITQMLWVNLIMDTFAALALATEPPHEDVMKRKPRKTDDFIISNEMSRNIFGVGIIFVVFLLGLLLYFQQGDGIVTTYESSLFFTIFIMLQFWNMFNARVLGSSNSAFTGLFENKWFSIIAGAILLGQIVFIQFGGSIFRTEPLEAAHWVLIFLGTSLVLWISEIFRFVSRQAKAVA